MWVDVELNWHFCDVGMVLQTDGYFIEGDGWYYFHGQLVQFGNGMHFHWYLHNLDNLVGYLHRYFYQVGHIPFHLYNLLNDFLDLHYFFNLDYLLHLNYFQTYLITSVIGVCWTRLTAIYTGASSTVGQGSWLIDTSTGTYTMTGTSLMT